MLAETTIDIGYQWVPILFGILVGLAISWLIAEKRRQARDRPGIFVGGPLPELGATFDASQRYDIVCVTEGRNPAIIERLQNTLILGYVGDKRGEPTLRSHLHSRWLVVALADGRRAYVLPRSVKLLVQSSAKILPPPLGDSRASASAATSPA